MLQSQASLAADRAPLPQTRAAADLSGCTAAGTGSWSTCPAGVSHRASRWEHPGAAASKSIPDRASAGAAQRQRRRCPGARTHRPRRAPLATR